MKAHLNLLRSFAGFTLLLAAGGAAAVERTETVECALPDGSHFVLSARHDWAPYAVFARHAADRMGQTGFAISYRARGAGTLLPTGDMKAHESLEEAGALEALCAGLAMHGGQPGTGAALRLPGEKRFWVPQPVSAEEDDAQLMQRGWRAHREGAALAVVDKVLVREVPLLTRDASDCFTSGRCPVQGALRWVSRDRGVQWEAMTIETAPYFFKTGVALAKQGGFARPTVGTVRNFRNSEAPRPAQPCPDACPP